MLVTSVLSLKGGVGKTSVVLGLAASALRRGVPTLVVDLDPQSNATIVLDPAPTRATVADLLSEASPANVHTAVAASAWGDLLRVVPGSETAELHNHPDPTGRALHRLRSALGRIRPAPELVLIDCPPSLGQLTRSGLVASDRALLVTEPALFAVTGVQRALEAINDERDAHRPDLEALGVIINRSRARSSEQDYRIGELKELFGPLVLNPTLPERSAIQQAQGAGVPIHEWPSAGAREVSAVFDRLLDRVLQSRSERLPQPVAS